MVDIEMLNMLLQETVPSGQEQEFQKVLTRCIRDAGSRVIRDEWGNHHAFTDVSTGTLFTVHVDDYSKRIIKGGVSPLENGGRHYLSVDPSGDRKVLGGDDKAGVYILLKMIACGVPGLYQFFVREETGRQGSQLSLREYPELYKKIRRVVSFDRKGTTDVIVKQKERPCCSDEFAGALIEAFGRVMPEYPFHAAHGVGTDSLTFVRDVPECTNISIGYDHAHTRGETLDLDYLSSLEEAVLRIDWEALPTVRQIQ